MSAKSREKGMRPGLGDGRVCGWMHRFAGVVHADLAHILTCANSVNLVSVRDTRHFKKLLQGAAAAVAARGVVVGLVAQCEKSINRMFKSYIF